MHNPKGSPLQVELDLNTNLRQQAGAIYIQEKLTQLLSQLDLC